MNIRPFAPADLPQLLHIYNASKLDELKNESAVFELLPLDQDPKRLGQLMASDIYMYQQTHVNGQVIVAYGAVYQSEIRALFVHPDNRGQGIGKALLEYLLLQVSGDASLHVAKSNHNAKALYEAYGFVVTGEFETEYNGVGVVANQMVRAFI